MPPEPKRRRGGGKRRTKTKKIPKLPVNAQGIKAKPKALEDPPMTLENVDRYKKSDCMFYETCLDHAAKSGWDQFHCRRCKIYEENPDVDVQFGNLISKLGKRDPTK